MFACARPLVGLFFAAALWDPLCRTIGRSPAGPIERKVCGGVTDNLSASTMPLHVAGAMPDTYAPIDCGCTSRGVGVGSILTSVEQPHARPPLHIGKFVEDDTVQIRAA